MPAPVCHRLRWIGAILMVFIVGGHIHGNDDWAGYRSVGTMVDYIWERIENGDTPERLPGEEELRTLDIFSRKRIQNLENVQAWHEGNALAGLQSAYHEQLDTYHRELAVISEIQFMARSLVLDWAIEDPGMEADAAYLLQNFGNEVVGLAYVLGQFSTSFDDRDRIILANLIVETALKYNEEFPPVVHQSLKYLIPQVVSLDMGDEVNRMLNHYLEMTE